MGNTHNKYIKRIEESLNKVAPKQNKQQLGKLASYIGTNHKVLGVDTPLQRQLAKEAYGITAEENWHDIMNAVYTRSNVFEVKNAALYIADKMAKKHQSQLFEILPEWIDFTDNWAHSDTLSKFYTGFLENEKHKSSFLKTLKEWNVSEKLWKRRQSLVSLYYYARCKKTYLPYRETEKMIHNLIDDKEHFVQKGLGWALRESYNVYPNETYNYILKNADKISSTAFSAAAEKMSISQIEVLKTKRKKSRIKN